LIPADGRAPSAGQSCLLFSPVEVDGDDGSEDPIFVAMAALSSRMPQTTADALLYVRTTQRVWPTGVVHQLLFLPSDSQNKSFDFNKAKLTHSHVKTIEKR